MPGNNHPFDCPCGWCWKISSSDSDDWPRWDNGPRWPRLRCTLESYTIPNARCPVCGEPVFFYQSPYNGRVFFDALGPPWPKHSCTDNPRIRVERFVVPLNHKPKPFEWQVEGWEPVIIEQIEKVGDWARLKLKLISLQRGSFIVRAMSWRDELAPGLPAHIKPLDVFGIGRISILFQTSLEDKIIKTPLVHRTFVACGMESFRKARKGDVASVCQVADATYRNWEKSGTEPGTLLYPPFVDFKIAKRWVQKASDLGSETAKRVLKTHSKFADAE
jgi:hypothetical protein